MAAEDRQARRCVLVGEGNLLIECGLLLRQAGMRIDAVVSDDAAVVQWARSLSLPTIGHGPDLVAWLGRAPFDYLLSVVNLRILPAEVLGLPRIAALNFHDGPLPRYAGLHAPSWALLEGETSYGITWHVMESTVDTGAIVRQRWFDVAVDESALSLQLKCFDAGLASLADMVPDLIRGTVATTPQDAARRTFYPATRRPAAGGMLDWSRAGEASEALARGLDFGPYSNPLVMPKIWTGAACLVGSGVRLAAAVTGAAPGTVLAMDGTSLTIATASRPVTVSGLATVDGEPLTIAEAARRHRLHVGHVLPVPRPENVERMTRSSEAVAPHERFWAGRLEALLPVSLLRSPRAARPSGQRPPVSLAWDVPEEVAAWLGRHGHRWRQGEFLLAAWGAFLARCGFDDRFDVEFASGETRIADACGVFAEHVPFRFDVGDDFAVVLERVREELAVVASRRTYPRDLVPRSPDLRCQPDLLRPGKLPVAVEFGAVAGPSDAGHDLVLRLPLEGREGSAVVSGELHDQMPRLTERFSAFVRNLAVSDGASLRGIPLVDDAERRALLEERAGTGDEDRSSDCLHHLFESQAAATPDAIAVRCGSATLTYRELEARAETLAGRLRRIGVAADVPVGVCLERSPEAIVGLLAILKAGGAYVPLDPTYPLHRLAFIVGDSGMRAVVSRRHLADRLPTGAVTRVYLDEESVGADVEAVEPVAVTNRDLAYIIYTSGSTGEPKGVMVEHRSVVNFTRAARARYGLGPGDRVLQFASLNFDASVEEIFPCLAGGGTVVLRNDDMLSSARVFMEQCAAWRITVLDLPTAYWHVLVMQMKEGGVPPCPDLRLVIIGGEAASPAHVAAWREMAGRQVALINTYGPTEATVIATWADLSGGAACDDAPIGVPIPGATVRVLDRWGQPLPAGFVGHLHIGGAVLARGYLNRPRLTSERFVPFPSPAVPGGRLYRTGDLCRWREDGMLAFHGRIDEQVKIRGHRVELGEIEAVLLTVPGIRQAAVVAQELKPGDTRLIAYLAENAGGVADDVVRHALARALPGFMMPAAFVRIESLPIDRSGKVDRRALPAPDVLRRADAAPRAAPRTPLEQRLADAWCELLGVDSVGVHDDFFHGGGNSLLAMSLVATIREACGVELPLRLVFERPTIAELASSVAAATARRAETSAATVLGVAIGKADGVPADLPASAAQQGMWLAQAISPDPATYNESLMFRAAADVDWRRVRDALGTLMDRHPALRTALVMNDERLVQRIMPRGAVALPWAEAELPSTDDGQRNREVAEVLRAAARRPFDLSQAPLWRVLLVRDGARGGGTLLFVFHHGIVDDWSLRLLFEEFAGLAAGSHDGATAAGQTTADASTQAVAIATRIEAGKQGHRDFWKEELRDLPDGPRWFTDSPRPPVATGRGAWHRFTIDAATVGPLRELASREHVTLFTVMLAACHGWLHRISGESDIVVGTPVADRRHPEARRLVGLFLNTLPIRLRWLGAPDGGEGLGGRGFRDVVGRVRDALHAALDHADLPFEQIVEVAARGRMADRQPLFRVLFAMLEEPLPAIPLGGDVVESEPVHTDTSKFDMTLFVVVAAGALRCRIEYSTDVLDEPTIHAYAEQFTVLLRSVAADPTAAFDEVGVLTPAERRLVTIDWSRSAGPPAPTACVHELFDAQAGRTPDAVALAWEGGSWTYRALQSRADRLAARLRARGVGPDVPVGLSLERSPGLFAGVLGILEAGGAYVPLDHALPDSRLAFMLRDAACPAVVTDERSLPRVRRVIEVARGASASWGDGDGPIIVLLDGDAPVAHRADDGLPPRPSTVDQLAYVLYTSGSTGQPKGVAMPHGPLVNLLGWQAAHSCVAAGGRTLQFASPGFDVSFQEMFSTWLSGGTLVLVSEHVRRDPSALLAAIDRDGIERLFLPVVMLEHLAEAAEALQLFPQSLREVIVAGEQLKITPAIRRFFTRLPACRLWNQYGPTETHVATGYLLPPNRSAWPDLPPIGRPIANTQAYLLDRRMQPVPRGVVGDLWIGGAAVARGYWRRPELTAERFVADPFADEPSRRLYRTGDRGRWRMDGQIEFLGRTDHQVKIRGHRVELGEVEAVLAEHPAVRAAAAVVHGDAGVARSIIAFLVGDEEDALRPAEVRSWLLTRLPEPMVPARLVIVPALPVNANGKIDRAALEARAVAAGRGDDADDGGQAFAAVEEPVGECEVILASLWKSLLAVRTIGRHDDFFAVGGTSLLAMRLVARARDALGVETAVRDVFEHPTLAGLAARWTPSGPAEHPPSGVIGPARRPDAGTFGGGRTQAVAASAAQRRLWFLQRYAPDAPIATIAAVHAVHGPLDVALLQSSLDRIVARHESLRTTFSLVDGDVVAAVAETATWPLASVDATGTTAAEREADALVRLAHACRLPFDLERGPLVRGCVIRLAPEKHVVSLSMHHAIFDGWSTGILHHELAECYAALRDGREPALDALPLQYADFAAWQNERARSGGFAEQEDYWRGQLAGAPSRLDLPTDKARPPVESFRGAMAGRLLDPVVVERLMQLGRQESCTPFMVLLATFAAMLGRWGDADDIVVGTPSADRSRQETADLIGCFVNTLAIRVDLSGRPSFRQVLDRVRTTMLGSFAHADLPFERLVELVETRRDAARAPVFQVMFAWQDETTSQLRLPGLEVRPLQLDAGVSRFDLTLFAVRTGRGVELRLEYATDLFEAATAARMLDGVASLLTAATADPDVPVAQIAWSTPDEQAAALAFGAAHAGTQVPDATLVELFAAQAARTPAAVAVSCEGRRLTYAELTAESARLARQLEACGVQPGDIVGILLDRSVDFVVAVLGIIQSGCAYAPLPAEYPDERLAFMVADTRMRLAVTTPFLSGRLPEAGVTRVFMGSDERWRRTAAAAGSVRTNAATITAESPAYVMYTSGSTGRPKGVVVPHRAVTRLVMGQSYAPFGPAMRTLLLAPTAFDASTFELWAPLLHGGTCAVFSDRHPDLARLGQVIRDEGITCLWLTAGLFHHVIDSRPEMLATVGHVLTGGDVLSVPHVEKARSLLPQTSLVNGYGPTESTTFACTHPIGRDEVFLHGTVPIGRPLANTTCVIVDASLRPTPIGMPGELLIGGAGLALGYLHQPELTAEKFIADPFSATPGARLYRTGDRCRWLPDGTIEFLGRQDGQVKIRGHRVEVGEIEAVLAAMPGVAQAVVVCGASQPADGGPQSVLRACVVPGPGAALDAGTLRRELATRLPEPMVPGEWLIIESLPLTAQGKIDRRGLAAAPATPLSTGEAAGRPQERVPPGTLLELEIAKIWQRLFGRDHVDLAADFFELGGHSLLAAQLAVELERLLGHAVPIATLFRSPTVESLARTLAEESWLPAWTSLVPIHPAGSRSPFFIVHGSGGDIFYFYRVARLLSADQPVYGVRAIDRDGRGPPHATVEEMARHYAREIRALQPEGPYCLGGYSAGGWIAHAVAAELRGQGQPVTLLVFDTYPTCRVPWPAAGMKLLIRGLAAIASLDSHLRQMAGLKVREWPRYVALRIRRIWCRVVATAPQPGPVRQAAAAQPAHAPPAATVGDDRYVQAVARYSAKVIDGRVQLFLARASRLATIVSWSQAIFWRLMVRGPVTVHRLPCNHWEIFFPQNVPGLAAMVDDALAGSDRPEPPFGGGA